MTYWLLLVINLSIKTLCLVTGILLLQQRHKGRSYIGLFLIVSFFSELAAFLLAYFKGNNMFVFYTFVPVSFVLVALFLESGNYRLRQKHLSMWMITLLLAGSVFSYCYGKRWKDPNAMACILGCALLIGATIDSLILYSSGKARRDTAAKELSILYVILFYSMSTVSVWVFFVMFIPGHYPVGLHRLIFYSLYLITNLSYLLLGLQLLPQKK